MDERTFKTLEIESLIALLARHVQSPLGRRHVLDLLPSTDRELINRELDLTTECADYISVGGAFGLGEVTDPQTSLDELHIEGTGLDPHQILALQSLVATGMDLRTQFGEPESRQRYPHLSSITL